MSTYTKIKLSNSTAGKGIKISGSATPGTTIHAASSVLTDIDEIYLYAYNSNTAPVNLTIEFGATVVPDDNIVASIPSKAGLYLVTPGLILSGSASPLVVRGFASTGSVVSIFGFVNRISA